MQGAFAAGTRTAEGVKHKHGNVNIKLFAVFGYAKKAAMHRAGGRT
jgi:hypothetical protein